MKLIQNGKTKNNMAKYILITHQKGGVGKSTLAFNLAQNLCKESKVAILDLDLQGSLSQIKNLVEDFEITTDIEVLNNAEDFDLIFIDSPPYLSDKLLGLIQLANLILVPTKAGVLDLLAIEATIELIKENKKLDKAMVVFNMVKPNTTLTNDILKELESYNMKVANTQVGDLVSFTRSILQKGVSRDNKSQRLIDNLTKEVLTALI